MLQVVDLKKRSAVDYEALFPDTFVMPKDTTEHTLGKALQILFVMIIVLICI